jgi:hypothetical protein
VVVRACSRMAIFTMIFMSAHPEPTGGVTVKNSAGRLKDGKSVRNRHSTTAMTAVFVDLLIGLIGSCDEPVNLYVSKQRVR